MLGPINLDFNLQFEHPENEGYGVSAIKGIDWVICGGESGPEARPVHPGWVRDLRDQCQDAKVPFLFKQWGEWLPDENLPWEGNQFTENNGRYRIINLRSFHGAGAVWTQRIGKEQAGRLLDGELWDQYPKRG